jgi:hypothetical protein
VAAVQQLLQTGGAAVEALQVRFPVCDMALWLLLPHSFKMLAPQHRYLITACHVSPPRGNGPRCPVPGKGFQSL